MSPPIVMSWLLPPLPPHFHAAVRDVHARRPESRIAAAERLGHASDRERDTALAGLLTLASDAHPSVRATAMAALGMLKDERSLDAVLARIDDAVPDVRELAAVALFEIGGDRALSALRAALKNRAPEVRFQAVAAVAELAPDTAARDIVPLLDDPDPEVRGQTIAALSSLKELHLSGHLAGALDDDVYMVKLEAALALAHVGDHRGDKVLLEALEARLRVHEVAHALGALGVTQAREPLARIALSFLAAPDVRAATGAALVLLGDTRGIDALRRVLRGFRSAARSYAVQLIAEIRADALLGELTRLATRLRGTDPLTLVAALATFANLEPARAALTKLAATPGEVGEAAQQALSRPPVHANTVRKEGGSA